MSNTWRWPLGAGSLAHRTSAEIYSLTPDDLDISVCACSLLLCIRSALNVCSPQKQTNEPRPLASKHSHTFGRETGENAEDPIGYETGPLSYDLKNPIWKPPPKKPRKIHVSKGGQEVHRSGNGVRFLTAQIQEGGAPSVLPLNLLPLLRRRQVGPHRARQAQGCEAVGRLFPTQVSSHLRGETPTSREDSWKHTGQSTLHRDWAPPLPPGRQAASPQVPGHLQGG